MEKLHISLKSGYCIDNVLTGIEGHPRDKKTAREREDDSESRKKIQGRIKELKDRGYPKEEAIKRLKRDFPNSPYNGFFETWIENAYAVKQHKKNWADKKFYRDYNSGENR